MTTLRSNMKVELTKQRQRRHRSAAPAKPKPQPTKRSTRKTKATPNISARPSRPHSGDSPQALRAKRRWVQQEFDAGRLSGKVTRELHDLYNKNTIGEPQLQETLALSLTDAAKAAKHRLEETFNETSGAGSVADVMSGILGDSSSSAAAGAPSDSGAIGDASQASSAVANTAAGKIAAARQWLVDLPLRP